MVSSTWVWVLALAACGGGDGIDGLTGKTGVYTVDTWTRNLVACDVEGSSIAANQDPHFFIKSEDFLGEQFINVNLCPSVNQCLTDARDNETLHIGQWGFQVGSDTSGWTDDSAFAIVVAGTCEATRVQTVMTFAGATVRIEERTSEGMFSPSPNNECPDADAAIATASSPCKELDVVTATFAAEL